MRVTSLDADGAVPGELRADVCIIGAGAAGLYLANRLARQRQRVVLIEAGPTVATSATDAGFDCNFSASPYRGATEGRAFGLGGTTSRWGGKLAAFSSGDAIREDTAIAAAWRHILDVGLAHAPAVFETLGIFAAQEAYAGGMTPEVIPGAHAAGLESKRSSWLPFGKRNLSWLRHDHADDIGTICCDAVAAKWELHQGEAGACRILGVVAASRSGRQLQVRARRFVIAAGAIESTRILCEIAAEGNDRVLPAGAALGHYLSDHLSVPVAEFEPSCRRRVAAMFAPRFAQHCMWTWRFVETQQEPGTCRYFAHVVFPTDNPGFQLVRSILQGVQRGRMPTLSPRAVVEGAAGAMRLAWDRWIHRQLHVASNSPCHLQIDMELRPHYCNAIKLDNTRDAFGRANVTIDWRVRDEDIEDLRRRASTFLERWTSLAPDMPIHPNDADTAGWDKPHDAYHPVGTCRLGDDSEAVADADLKVRGTENLFVLSTAVLPSAGSANPTLNLLCFAEKLAVQLAKETP